MFNEFKKLIKHKRKTKKKNEKFMAQNHKG